MARAALIKDNLVTNVIEVAEDSGYEPEEGYELRKLTDEDQVGPGWTVTKDGYSPPAEEEAAPNPDDELDAAIGAATTLDELKAALRGTTAGAVGRVAAKRRQ